MNSETEWFSCANPLAMLDFLRGRASDRKLRLFAAACCRRIWHLLPDPSNRDLVQAVENHPEGIFDDPELKTALAASSAHEQELASDEGYWTVKYLGRSYYKFSPLESAVAVAIKVSHRVREERSAAAEKGEQAALLRDLFGNPFRPVTPDPAWLQRNDDVVQSMARSIYDGREFDRVPALADALAQAGCDNSDLLTHCRGLGPHVRGCWVIDLLLGKE